MGYQFDGINAPTNSTDNYGVAYSQFVMPLVKAVQEQQVVIETQNKKIEALQKDMEEIKKLLKK
jgi:trimeric autotransporter adhesin